MIFRSLQMRLVFIFGLCLTASVGAAVIYGIYSTRKTEDFVSDLATQAAHKAARSVLIERADAMSFDIESALESSLTTSRTLADLFSGIKNPEMGLQIDRERIVRILQSVLEKNPHLAGIGTVWEPNALDGLDELYANTPGHDETGRLVSYWGRSPDGEILLEPVIGYESTETFENGLRKGEFYLLPKERGRASIIDPYPYPIQGKTFWMATLAVPIMNRETFYGIVGADLRLDFMQEIARRADADLFNGVGSIAVISRNGLIAAASDHEGLIGKHIRKWIEEDWAEDLSELAESEVEIGEEIEVDLDGETMDVTVPMQIGDTGMTWAVMIQLPTSAVLAEVRQMQETLKKRGSADILQQAGVGAAVGLIALLLVWLFARRISGPIKAVIGGLTRNAGRLTDSAGKISEAGRRFSDGADQQAVSLQEVAASLEQMEAMTRQNSNNAREADLRMRETREMVGLLDQSMAEMEGFMDEITQVSRETSKVVRSIDEIAFQTNLLSLNAAVEAARAGDSGAGFAVVATEVRNLALRSGEAAKETAQAIDKTVRRIGEGVDLVAKTQQRYRQVTENVTRVSELVSEIAAASDEQFQGIDGINKAVSAIDELTRANAEDAQNFAYVSEDMEKQAVEIDEMVSGLAALAGTRGAEENTKRNKIDEHDQDSHRERNLTDHREGTLHLRGGRSSDDASGEF